MHPFSRYLAYLKDNPEHYWFKRKLYGWGWTPATWQGWLLMALFILFVAGNAVSVPLETAEPAADDFYWFFTKLIVAVAVLILICYKTGEKPRWQWGLPEEEKHNKTNLPLNN